MIALLVSLGAHAAPPDLEVGRATYVARCQACHGEAGKGDGPAVRALARPPADLSDPAFWKAADLALVRGVITNGRPGTPMRGFPMPAERLDALMAYIQSLSRSPSPSP